MLKHDVILSLYILIDILHIRLKQRLNFNRFDSIIHYQSINLHLPKYNNNKEKIILPIYSFLLMETFYLFYFNSWKLSCTYTLKKLV